MLLLRHRLLDGLELTQCHTERLDDLRRQHVRRREVVGVEEYRLPQGEDARKAYTAVVGHDGMTLLDAVYASGAPDSLRELSAIDVLRRVRLHQFVVGHGVLRLRTAKELPPAGLRIESPYDAEARYGHKRSTTWSGYKAHLTETCDDDAPHLVVHVVTTGATEPDIGAAWPVHEALDEKGLLPGEHYLDAGYVDADLLVQAPTEYGVEVVGSVRPDVSWQATEGGYDVSQSAVDWDRRRVTCPEGMESLSGGHGSTTGRARRSTSSSPGPTVGSARAVPGVRGPTARPATSRCAQRANTRRSRRRG